MSNVTIQTSYPAAGASAAHPLSLLVLACVSTLVLACGSTENRSAPSVVETRAPIEVEQPERIRFAWPTPGSVAVEETVTYSGIQLTLRYRIEIARAPSTTHLKVQFRDWQALNLDEIRLDRSVAVETRQTLLNAAETPPSFTVDRDGKIVALADFILFSQTPRVTPLSEPRSRDEWLREVTSWWYCWVQLWLENKLPASGATVGIAPKEELARLTNRGRSADSSAHLQLSYRWGPEDRRAIVQEIENEIAREGAQDTAAQVQQASVQVDMSVEIEPDTGKPRKASSRVYETVTYSGREPQVNELIRAYRFTW